MSEGVQALLTPLTAAIFAITFFIVWSRDRTRRAVLAIALGYTGLSVGFFISQLTPDSLGRANIVVTNIPYALGCIAMVWGILHRVGIDTPMRILGGIAVIGGGLGIVSLQFGNSVEADLYIANTTYGLIFAVAALLLWLKADDDMIERILLIVIVINVVQMFARPPLSFMFTQDMAATGNYRDTVYYTALTMIMALGSLVLGLTLIAACIKDQFTAVHDDFAKDRLSGLLTRRAFEGRVREAIADAQQNKVPLAFIIGDIDHFKQVNDIWGHQVGDSAIEAFGSLVLRTVRDKDICGRVGGEEFCILVWNADATIAASLAERLRIGITGIHIAGMSSDTHLTASFGTAGLQPEEGYRKLFARADQALYRAKEAGRNAVGKDGEDVSQTRRKDDPHSPANEAA